MRRRRRCAREKGGEHAVAGAAHCPFRRQDHQGRMGGLQGLQEPRVPQAVHCNMLPAPDGNTISVGRADLEQCGLAWNSTGQHGTTRNNAGWYGTTQKTPALVGKVLPAARCWGATRLHSLAAAARRRARARACPAPHSKPGAGPRPALPYEHRPPSTDEHRPPSADEAGLPVIPGFRGCRAAAAWASKAAARSCRGRGSRDPPASMRPLERTDAPATCVKRPLQLQLGIGSVAVVPQLGAAERPAAGA
eukprot:gene8164-biopygen9143